MLDTIKIFSKYKDDKRLQKEIEKRNKTIAKARNRRSEKIQKEIANSKKDIITRNEIQLTRFEKNQRREAEKKAREMFGIKQTKQTLPRASDSTASRRDKALAQFQKYIRLWETDIYDHTVTCYDTGEKRRWNDRVNAGHIYSKHNFPHLAFEFNNCRPITKKGNKIQGDSIASRQDMVLTKKEQQELADMAYDATPEYKAKFTTKEYYKEQYEKYKELNKKQLERLKNK